MDCPVDFVPVIIEHQYVCVMKNYYQKDGELTPLTFNEAKDIAEQNGWKLPSKDQVDQIWEQADCKLKPMPLPPTNKMTTQYYFDIHNNIIQQQMPKNCKLVAGHKKDVLEDGSIYGWHRLNGKPIQPVFYGHGRNYKDYSHGIRFIIDCWSEVDDTTQNS